MRTLAFIYYLLISTTLMAADSPVLAVKSYLNDVVLVNKGLIGKSALWNHIDDSALIQKYGNHWSEIRPKIEFNGYKEDSYVILRSKGDFVIAGVVNSGWEGHKTPRYLLFIARKDGAGRYKLVPVIDRSDNRYVDPYLISLDGLVSQDIAGGSQRDYLSDICTSIRSGDTSAKTPRSDVVTAYLKAFQTKESSRSLWSYFDTSDLKKTLGQEGLNRRLANWAFNGYSSANFKIEKEVGNLVLASYLSQNWIDQQPVYVLFYVRKGNDGGYKIIPGRSTERFIDPHVVDLGNQSKADRFFSNIGFYCSSEK